MKGRKELNVVFTPMKKAGWVSGFFKLEAR